MAINYKLFSIVHFLRMHSLKESTLYSLWVKS